MQGAGRPELLSTIEVNWQKGAELFRGACQSPPALVYELEPPGMSSNSIDSS